MWLGSSGPVASEVTIACGHSQAMPEGGLVDLSKEYISTDLGNAVIHGAKGTILKIIRLSSATCPQL